MDIFFLIISVAGLWLGTEFTIRGALAIAKRYQFSEFFVGLVILSFGSDLPELAVAVHASLKSLGGLNSSGVVVGSAIGSVMAQMGFVLGVAGLIAYLTLPNRYVFKHGAILLGSTIMLFLLAFDGVVTREEGLVLLTLYAIYIFVLMKGERLPRDTPPPMSVGSFKSWALLVLGLSVVVGCSDLTVTLVVRLASEFGISASIISVLVIGIGTSLPELSISIGAIVKKKNQLSVGNIIGSNIFDTLVPVGVAAVISPVLFERGFLLFDLPYVFLLTLVTLMFFYRKRGLQSFEAIIILGMYLLYIVIKLV